MSGCRAPSRSHRRALTLLEVILATSLLATVSSILVSTFSSLQSDAEVQQHRLNATEVAHKLIIQYLHNPNQMPDESLRIEQGKDLYRYVLLQEILTEESRRDRVSRRRARNAQNLSQNERLGAGLVMITIHVHHYIEGASLAQSGPPIVSLSRIFDPYASPDESTLLRHVEILLGQELNLPSQR
ncbi:MAG: type II secretion system protein [Planctomycetota bacterium]|jgi:hypothetical protein